MPSSASATVFSVDSHEKRQIAKLVIAFRVIGTATVGALELDRELNSILEEVTDTLKFEFATVALVDEYRCLIETVRGKNVPLGLRDIFKCRLEADHILANVARSGQTQIIRGWDSKLEPEILGRFGFATSVRVFAPIISGTNVVGVIWAGCPLELEKDIVTPQSIDALKCLGVMRGARVAGCRPYVLLEVIAQHAIGIIEADSASIHIVQRGQPLLEATAGRATREFLHNHPPSSNGIGAKAMSSGEPQWVDDPSLLRATHSGLYNEGIRAFAAFPLAFGADVRGVLYVHFWAEHQITLVERELETAFARQMEVAIKNNLLMKDVAEYVEKAWMTSGLQKMLTSVASRSTLSEVTEEIVRHSLYMLGADNVTLYRYFQAENHFGFPPAMAGTFRNHCLMTLQVEPADVLWKLVRQGAPVFVEDASTHEMLAGLRTDARSQPRFVEREGIKSLVALPLKAGPAEEIVGLMFVNYRHNRKFPAEDKRIISAVGTSAAIALQSARLHDQIRRDLSRRNKEIEALREIDQKISSIPVPDLRQIWELILSKAVDILGASAGSAWSVSQDREDSEMAAYWPNTGSGNATMQGFHQKVVSRVVKERTLVTTCQPGTSQCQLGVPLMDRHEVVGVIVVDSKLAAFGERDQGLLETFAALAITALHIVDEYRQLTEQIQSFRSLCLIEARIQDAKNDLETLLLMLTTGITAKQGLGLSRAMVLLSDEDETLNGVTAIGALTKAEADSTWRRLRSHSEDSAGQGKSETDILAELLRESERHASAVRGGRERDWPLCEAFKGIEMSISGRKGAIRDCLVQGKPLVVEAGQPDPFRRVLAAISGMSEEEHAFVCVPLIGKDKKQLGVLVADNRFLPCEHDIDRAKIHSLEAFAGVAAMSIENAKLRDAYRQEAVRAEKRAKLFGEVLVETSHEFRSPLQNILGQIPILRKHVEPQSIGATVINGIEDEIFRAKTVMTNSLSFGAEVAYNMSLSSLRPIFEACTCEYENRAAERHVRIIIWDNAKHLPKIEMDSVRIRQVVTNLLDNAVKYSFYGELIHVRGRDIGKHIEFSVQDKGLGIPEAHRKRIFSEFVRHVVADPKRFIPGTGVGLKVVEDITHAHNGDIEVTSVPFLDDPLRQKPEDGHTVTFTVRLPKTRSI